MPILRSTNQKQNKKKVFAIADLYTTYYYIEKIYVLH